MSVIFRSKLVNKWHFILFSMAILLSLIVAIALVILILVYLPFHIDVSKFQGDGHIRSLGTGIAENGYIIEFEKVKLDNLLEKEYQEHMLPRSHKPGVVSICIKYPDSDKCFIDATVISLSVINSHGKVIYEESKKRLNEFSQCDENVGKVEGVSFYYFDSKCTPYLYQKDIKNGFVIKFKVDYLPKELIEQNITARLVYSVGGFY